MIVCICNNVNCKSIKKAIEKGYSLKEIKNELKVGSTCGTCIPTVIKIIQKEG